MTGPRESLPLALDASILFCELIGRLDYATGFGKPGVRMAEVSGAKRFEMRRLGCGKDFFQLSLPTFKGGDAGRKQAVRPKFCPTGKPVTNSLKIFILFCLFYLWRFLRYSPGRFLAPAVYKKA